MPNHILFQQLILMIFFFKKITVEHFFILYLFLCPSCQGFRVVDGVAFDLDKALANLNAVHFPALHHTATGLRGLPAPQDCQEESKSG